MAKLNIIFLGKKPTYFDDFLFSLNEKIREKVFSSGEAALRYLKKKVI